LLAWNNFRGRCGDQLLEMENGHWGGLLSGRANIQVDWKLPQVGMPPLTLLAGARGLFFAHVTLLKELR